MQGFVSYNHETQAAVATRTADALRAHDLDVWHDSRQRRPLRRLFGRSTSELGLDPWLRSGIRRSDLVISLVPYYPQRRYRKVGSLIIFDGSEYSKVRPIPVERILHSLSDEMGRLLDAYSGGRPGEASKPEKMVPYLLSPVHLSRRAFYEKHGFHFGKDPYEPWRHTEARIAGNYLLPLLMVVVLEKLDEPIYEELSAALTDNDSIVVARESYIESDVANILVPRIEGIDLDESKRAEIKARKRALVRLRFREIPYLTVEMILVTAVIIGVFVQAVVLDLWMLLKLTLPILVPLAVFGAFFYFLLR